MILYVLRHGRADVRDALKYPDDGERPLTESGSLRLARQVDGLNSIGLRLDVVISSPLVRAVQTAQIVRERLSDPGRFAISESLAPGAHPYEMLDELSGGRWASGGRVMIVGHEPHLSVLVATVVTSSAEPVIRLKKGALCKLRVPCPRQGRCGWIEWHLTARQMVKLG